MKVFLIKIKEEKKEKRNEILKSISSDLITLLP